MHEISKGHSERRPRVCGDTPRSAFPHKEGFLSHGHLETLGTGKGRLKGLSLVGVLGRCETLFAGFSPGVSWRGPRKGESLCKGPKDGRLAQNRPLKFLGSLERHLTESPETQLPWQEDQEGPEGQEAEQVEQSLDALALLITYGLWCGSDISSTRKSPSVGSSQSMPPSRPWPVRWPPSC